MPMPINSECQGKKTGAFYYYYKGLDSSTCQITKINVLDTSKAKVMKVPDTIDGKSCKNGSIRRYRDILLWPQYFWNVSSRGRGRLLASQSSKIYQVSKRYHLPKYLKKITKNCFSFLPQLEKISVPAALSKTAEYLCDTKWKNFQVSSGNKSYKVSKGFLLSKSGKTVYGPACKKNECVNTSGCKKDI